MCNVPYIPINQQEITCKATYRDHSISSHTRRLLLLFLSTLILASCGLLGGKKKDQGLPGFIVFSAKDSLGHNELFRMKPDGSHIRQLTNMGSDGAFSPAISPDGKTIVFSTAKNYTTLGMSMYLINADGTDLRPLGKQYDPLSEDSIVVYGSEAIWSPDGQKVAYNVCYQCELGGLNQEIFVYDRKAKTVTRLTNNPAEDSNPSWSPDGSEIAFVSNRDYYQADTLRFRTDLYVMDSDGQDTHRLTQDGYVSSPIWKTQTSTVIYGSYKTANYKLFFDDLNTAKTLEFIPPIPGIARPIAILPAYQQLLLATVAPNFELYFFNYKSNTVQNILDGYSNVVGISMYTPKE